MQFKRFFSERELDYFLKIQYVFLGWAKLEDFLGIFYKVFKKNFQNSIIKIIIKMTDSFHLHSDLIIIKIQTMIHLIELKII